MRSIRAAFAPIAAFLLGVSDIEVPWGTVFEAEAIEAAGPGMRILIRAGKYELEDELAAADAEYDALGADIDASRRLVGHRRR